MMRKIVLVLLPIVLLALVWPLVIGEAEHVSAQGMIEYTGDLAVEYDLLFFEPDGWRSRLKEGCVVYEPEHPTAWFQILLTEDLWVALGGEGPRDVLRLEYEPMEVVTVCGDTVHFYYRPPISGS